MTETTDWWAERLGDRDRVRGTHLVNGSSTHFPSVADITSRLVVDNRRLGVGELADSA